MPRALTLNPLGYRSAVLVTLMNMRKKQTDKHKSATPGDRKECISFASLELLWQVLTA